MGEELWGRQLEWDGIETADRSGTESGSASFMSRSNFPHLLQVGGVDQPWSALLSPCPLITGESAQEGLSSGLLRETQSDRWPWCPFSNILSWGAWKFLTESPALHSTQLCSIWIEGTQVTRWLWDFGPLQIPPRWSSGSRDWPAPWGRCAGPLGSHPPELALLLLTAGIMSHLPKENFILGDLGFFSLLTPSFLCLHLLSSLKRKGKKDKTKTTTKKP